MVDDRGYPLAVQAKVSGQSLFAAVRPSWLTRTDAAWDESMVDRLYTQQYRIPNFFVDAIHTQLPVPHVLHAISGLDGRGLLLRELHRRPRASRGHRPVPVSARAPRARRHATKVLDAPAEASRWDEPAEPNVSRGIAYDCTSGTTNSVELKPSVTCARHALAIHEVRRHFIPDLWKARSKEMHQDVKQVWFRGSHSDVGGGLESNELSDSALQWMLDEAEKVDLSFDRNEEHLPLHLNATTEICYSWRDKPWWIFRPSCRGNRRVGWREPEHTSLRRGRDAESPAVHRVGTRVSSELDSQAVNVVQAPVQPDAQRERFSAEIEKLTRLTPEERKAVLDECVAQLELAGWASDNASERTFTLSMLMEFRGELSAERRERVSRLSQGDT